MKDDQSKTLEQKIHQRAVEINAKTVACYPGDAPEPEPEPEPVVSERHAAIQQALDHGDWGCRKDAVRQLVEALTEEKFTAHAATDESPYRRDIKAVAGICIVPTANTNGRSEAAAPMGELAVICAVDEEDTVCYVCVANSTDEDAWLPNCSSESRPATVEEIEALLIKRALGDD